MDYKKFCKIFSICAMIIIITFLGLAVVVDPLGIIGSPIIKGFNQCKLLDGYMHVIKPYEVAKIKPKVIFIGSSRVLCGWRTCLENYEDYDVYNLAFGAMSFEQMDSYLSYCVKFGTVEKVFLGIDFAQFCKEWDEWGKNYSQGRLKSISNSNMYVKKIVESMQIGFLPVLNVINKSFKYYKKSEKFIGVERGANISEGEKSFDNYVAENSMKQYTHTYRNFKYDNGKLDLLKEIIRRLQNRNIKVYVFVNPIHRRLYDLLCDYGHEQKWNEIKEEIIKVAGKVYELREAEKFIDDNRFYSDVSHYNMKLGEILKAQILADN